MSEEDLSLGQRIRRRFEVPPELDLLAAAIMKVLKEYRVPWPRQLAILEKLSEIMALGMLTLADRQYLCTPGGWYHVDSTQQLDKLPKEPVVMLSINLNRLQRMLDNGPSLAK